MRRSPCRDKSGVNKGLWSPEEDEILVNYIQKNGRDVCWRALPKNAGLNRNGKSCRLRWTNYLRPGIKRGSFTPEEEQRILNLHANLGNQWSTIASRLPGRTDNEIKNYWNTHLKKKLSQMGFDPTTHRPQTDSSASLPQLLALANLKDRVDQAVRLQSEATAKLHYLQTILQIPPSYDDSASFTADVETLKLLTSLAQSSESSVPSFSGSGSSSPHDHQGCFTFAELQRNAFETSNYLNKPDSSTNISDHVLLEPHSGVDFTWQLPPLYATGALVANPTVEVQSNLSVDWPHFGDLGLSGTAGGLMS